MFYQTKSVTYNTFNDFLFSINYFFIFPRKTIFLEYGERCLSSIQNIARPHFTIDHTDSLSKEAVVVEIYIKARLSDI